MSSQASRRRTPSAEEHLEALKQALVDVAQESFFSFAEFCGPERFTDALDVVAMNDSGTTGRWLTASVSFDGAFAGRVTVVLPRILAGDLAASIAGLMPGDPIEDDLVLDAVGEFANMVCGTWLTRSCVHRRFDLHPPVVQSRETLPEDESPDDVRILINDWPGKLMVTFVAA